MVVQKAAHSVALLAVKMAEPKESKKVDLTDIL